MGQHGSVPHRGIVVMHGVGSSHQGGFLEYNVQPLCRALNRLFYEADELPSYRVVLAGRCVADSDGVMQSDIHLINAAGEVAEVWEVREAWWDQAFLPSPSGTVLGWLVLGVLNYFVRSIQQSWLPSQPREGKRTGGQEGIWQTPRTIDDPLFVLLNRLNSFVITACVFIFYLIGIPLAVILVLLLQLPLIGQIQGVGAVIEGLLNFLTSGFGDQHAMTTRPVARAAAAATLTAALRPFLDPQRPMSSFYKTVTMLVHSGGNVPTLDALTGPVIRGWLGLTPDGAGQPARRLTWVSLGSGLNIAYQMRLRWDRESTALFPAARQPAEPPVGMIGSYVNWVDIFARHDPITFGEPPSELVELLMGKSERRQPARESLLDPRPYVSVQVVNHDWPFRDHGAYWDNQPEVMARIIYLIANDSLCDEPTLVTGRYVGPTTGTPAAWLTGARLTGSDLAATLCRGMEKVVTMPEINAHRRRVIGWCTAGVVGILAVAWSVLTLPPLVGLLVLCGALVPALGVLLLIVLDRSVPGIHLFSRQHRTHPWRAFFATCLLAVGSLILLIVTWPYTWVTDVWARSLVGLAGRVVTGGPPTPFVLSTLLGQTGRQSGEVVSSYIGWVFVALAGIFLLRNMKPLVETVGNWLADAPPIAGKTNGSYRRGTIAALAGGLFILAVIVSAGGLWLVIQPVSRWLATTLPFTAPPDQPAFVPATTLGEAVNQAVTSFLLSIPWAAGILLLLAGLVEWCRRLVDPGHPQHNEPEAQVRPAT